MGRGLDLLIVDDDPAQLHLIQSLLGELGLKHRCHYAPNGLDALAFLERTPPFQDAAPPNLILLDVEMPGMSGCDVLRQLKSHPVLRTIPVIMISGSQSLKEVDVCYSEHANAYVSKGADLNANLGLLKDITHFWCETVILLD